MKSKLTNFLFALLLPVMASYGPVEAHASTMIGNSADNTLQGGPGPDELYGDGTAYDGDPGFNEPDPMRPPEIDNTSPASNNGGNDTLYGRNGNDRLYGQGGLDRLNGGLGADTFVFEDPSAWHDVDIVEDFSVADGDKLDISGLLISYRTEKDNPADFVRIESKDNGSIVSVDRDGSSSAYGWSPVVMLEKIVGPVDVKELASNGNLLLEKH